MFFVINKEKICAYIVSVLTVCFLFIIASNNNFNEKKVETSSNVYNVNEENHIEEKDEKNVNTNKNNTKNNIIQNRKE
ncbi:MAG: hypothetical protein J6I85_03955 [Clostridia bacterium]|nr:hypothetical protein [Clostridia bacterium]